MPQSNKKINKAKANKNDEFYTKREDIEKELKNYISYFENKTIFCNCDDPDYSNFYFFFKEKFEIYKIKKLITTHYEKDEKKQSFKIEIINKNGKLQETKTPLKENGDFRSQECVELLKESDIVVTNPPFSLFREYVKQLMDFNKKFLIIGPQTQIACKDIFNYIKNGKLWFGFGFKNGTTSFYTNTEKTKDKMVTGPKVHWFTNLEHYKRYEELVLYEKYTPNKYPKYYNYNAINVDKSNEIPMDYYGEIGVPITFLNWFNPNQFEIIGLSIPSSIKFINKKLEVIENKKSTGKYINTTSVLYIPHNNKKDSPLYKDEKGKLWQSTFKRLIIKNKKVGK